RCWRRCRPSIPTGRWSWAAGRPASSGAAIPTPLDDDGRAFARDFVGLADWRLAHDGVAEFAVACWSSSDVGPLVICGHELLGLGGKRWYMRSDAVPQFSASCVSFVKGMYGVA